MKHRPHAEKVKTTVFIWDLVTNCQSDVSHACMAILGPARPRRKQMKVVKHTGTAGGHRKTAGLDPTGLRKISSAAAAIDGQIPLIITRSQFKTVQTTQTERQTYSYYMILCGGEYARKAHYGHVTTDWPRFGRGNAMTS